MLCEFALIGTDGETRKNRVRCRRCGRAVTTPYPPERVYAECRSPVWLGFGDAVAWLTHVTRIDRLVTRWSRWRGKPCGCAARQSRMNRWLPFPRGLRKRIAYLVSVWRVSRRDDQPSPPVSAR